MAGISYYNYNHIFCLLYFMSSRIWLDAGTCQHSNRVKTQKLFKSCKNMNKEHVHERIVILLDITRTLELP